MPHNEALSYSETGQGTPVVLLHGFPLCRDIWLQQRQRLSDRYRVITPDLRGHGQSPAPTGVYTMDALAQDVLALLDALEIKQAVLMGHSLGGYVTLAAWKLAPERFLALGLIDSHASADTEEGRQGRYQMVEKVTARGSQVVADVMLPRLFSPYLDIENPIINQVRQMILATPTAGIIGALQGMAERPDVTGQLPEINVPVLLLAGNKDQIIPLEKAQAMATVIPQATLTVIENAGHMPMLELPMTTTMAISHFLNTVVGK